MATALAQMMQRDHYCSGIVFKPVSLTLHRFAFQSVKH